jgi:hypothetical protein
MRDRQRDAERRSFKTLRSTEASAVNTLWIVLTWAAIFFLLFKAFTWWEARRVVPTGSSVVERTQDLPSAQSRKPSDSVPTSATAQQSPAYAYQPAQTAPQGHAVTKCVGGSGTSYSDGPCPTGAAATTVITSSDQNVSEGLGKGPYRSHQQAPQEAIVPPARAVTTATNVVKTACDALTTELRELDARARQPLSGQTQDWIRDKQRKLRARKFELRC